MARLTISEYSLTLKHYAGVLELVDNADLKSVGCKPVRVQVPPPAPIFMEHWSIRTLEH